MSGDGLRGISSKASRGRPDGVGLLRAVSRIAVLAGAIGALGLMLRAGRNTPRFLLVLFFIWVLSPFAALAWANIVAKRWSALTRTTLYCVTLVISMGSLAIYGAAVMQAAGSPRATVFVVVPPGSWLLMAIAVSTAAFVSRRR